MNDTDKLLATINTIIDSLNKTSLDVLQSHMLWVRIESVFSLLMMTSLIVLSARLVVYTNKFFRDKANKNDLDGRMFFVWLSVVSVFVTFIFVGLGFTKTLAQLIDPRLYYVFKVLN